MSRRRTGKLSRGWFSFPVEVVYQKQRQQRSRRRCATCVNIGIRSRPGLLRSPPHLYLQRVIKEHHLAMGPIKRILPHIEEIMAGDRPISRDQQFALERVTGRHFRAGYMGDWTWQRYWWWRRHYHEYVGRMPNPYPIPPKQRSKPAVYTLSYDKHGLARLKDKTDRRSLPFRGRPPRRRGRPKRVSTPAVTSPANLDPSSSSCDADA